MTQADAQVFAVQPGSGCPTDAGWTYLSTPEQISPVDGNETPGLYGPITVGWTDPPVIYSAGLHRGLQRSNDCGHTWESVQPRMSGVRDIDLDQLGQIQLINYQGPLARSLDSGKTWDGPARVYYAGDSLGSVAYAFTIATSPKVPGQAYGVIHPYAGRRGSVLAQTMDSGASWHVFYDGFPGGLLLVDPVRDLLYVTCGDQSGDESLCQIDLASSDLRAKPFSKPPAAIVAHAMSADGSRHWIATRDGKVHHSLNRGLTWEAIKDVPDVGLWRHLAASRTDPGSFFAVAADGGIWMYREPSVKVAPVQIP